MNKLTIVLILVIILLWYIRHKPKIIIINNSSHKMISFHYNSFDITGNKQRKIINIIKIDKK